tara:strand:- start:296 stop:472 length:177 start_codon:yes stop_codon:yes gene_type:complete
LELLLVLANQGIASKFDHTLWFQDMPFNTLFATSKCMVKAGVSGLGHNAHMVVLNAQQ